MILPHPIVIWAVLTSAVTLLSPSRASAQEPTWSDTVETIAISPDGRLLASGGTSTIVAVWDVQTGLVARELTGHPRRFGRSASATTASYSPVAAVTAW